MAPVTVQQKPSRDGSATGVPRVVINGTTTRRQLRSDLFKTPSIHPGLAALQPSKPQTSAEDGQENTRQPGWQPAV